MSITFDANIGTIVVSETSGSTLVVDTNVLVVDATNNRVGVNNASPSVALDVTGAGKFSGDLAVDTNVLKVDSANNRVGVNVTSPAYTLDVVGSGATSATRSLNVTNSAGTAYVLFRDDGLLSVSPTSSSPRAFSIHEIAGGTEIGMSIAGTTAGLQSFIKFSDGVTGGDEIRYYPRSTTDQTFYFQDTSGGSDSAQPKVAIGYDAATSFSSSPAGSLLVLGDLAVDTNVLKVDSANNRVGVNVTSPAVALDVAGAIANTTTITAGTGGFIATDGTFTSSVAATGGNDYGFVFNTTNNLSGSSDRVFSFQRASSEILWLSGSNNLSCAGAVIAGAHMRATAYYGTTAATCVITSDKADGAANTAIDLDSGTAFATLGSKLTKIKNAGTEKVFWDHTGGYGNVTHTVAASGVDVCFGTLTIASGNTSGTFVASTTNFFKNCKVIATPQTVSTNNISVRAAASDNDKTITITLSGDPGASGVDVTWFILRTATPG